MSSRPNTEDNTANFSSDRIGVSPGLAGELGLTFAGNYNPKREPAKPVRGQKSEVGDQRSEVRDQRSDVGSGPGPRQMNRTAWIEFAILSPFLI